MRTNSLPGHRPARSSRLSPLAAAVAIALSPGVGLAATFTVTTDADSGAGSLRQAITDHLAACGSVNTIDFAITPGTGPFTISLASALPSLQCPTDTNLTIAGYDGRTRLMKFSATSTSS